MVDLCNEKDDKGQVNPSSCVLCLEIQYFPLWGALALGSCDDMKATPVKEDGNKPTWPTSVSHGPGSMDIKVLG